jgi:hypothetical protein
MSVWIYQSNRPFRAEELQNLENQLATFAREWVSHSRQLVAKAEVLHERFVVLSVDETQQGGASGCSIDSSVRFMKQLEQQYQVELFNRFLFSYIADNEVHTVDSATFAAYYKQGVINDETLVFDTLVNTREALTQHFVKPLGTSWHRRMV